MAKSKSNRKPKKDELEFVSPRLSAILQQGSKRAHLLGRLSFVFFILFIIWAYFAPLNEVTKGQGKVITSTRIQTISNLEGGIVREILVQDGDAVVQGQVLVRLDTTASVAKYKQDTENYYRYSASKERLLAQLHNVPFRPTQALLTMAPHIAQEELASFHSRVSKHHNDIQILRKDLAIKQQETTEARARLKNYMDQIAIVNQQKRMVQPLQDRGLHPKVESFKLERDLTDLQNQANLLQVGILKSQAVEAQAQEKIQQVVLSYRQEIMADLREVELRLTEISGSRTATEDRVRRSEVVSPVKGIVREMKVRTIGGVIQPGEPILDIAPDDKELLIEVNILPENMAHIHPGMPAIIKVSAYDFSVYGGLDAVVESISSDAIIDKREVATFRIYLRAKKNFIVKEGRSYPIKPGMQVEADMRTGQKTILVYLLKPFLRGIQSALSER